MSFKPQEYFLNFSSLVSRVIPGSVLIYALIISGYSQKLAFTVPFTPGSVEAWAVFLVASYFVGHFVQLLSSVLNLAYDNWYQNWKRRKGDPLHDSAKQLKNRILGKYPALKNTKGTFPYARNYVAAIDKDMDAKLDEINAESDFFRSLVIIFLLTALLFIGNQTWQTITVCLAMAFGSFWRYLDLRWKNTNRTYLFFIMSVAKDELLEK